MFQQFSGKDPGRPTRRLAASLAIAVACYLVLGVALAQLIARYATPVAVEKEVEVTFVKAPPPLPAAPPPVVVPPPPPPPPPTPRPRNAPPPRALPPRPLEAPKEVPQQAPAEADPSQETGLASAPSDAVDPAGLPGGSGPVVAAPPPPPPPPRAVVLPPGATPAKRLDAGTTPEYPKLARAAGIEGEVIVKLIVHVDGRVELVSFLKSDPNFDEAVRAFLGRLRYSPALYEGRPLAVFVNMRIPFKLRD